VPQGVDAMQRLALAAPFLLTALVLAGCSSSPSSGDPSASSPSSHTFTVVAGNAPATGPLTSDTYHFLAWPDLTPAPPTATDPISLPVSSIANSIPGVTQSSAQAWSTELPVAVHGLVGTARVWVEVKGTLVGNPFSVTSGGCFWGLDATIGSDFVGLGCKTEGLQVQPGLYELNFTFAATDKSWPAGTPVSITFHTAEWVQRAPGTSVEMLTASVPYDSYVQVYGLKLPIDSAALLEATSTT
jgi:hypothetical protein